VKDDGKRDTKGGGPRREERGESREKPDGNFGKGAREVDRSRWSFSRSIQQQVLERYLQ
jgi:hypothetical protein